MSTYEDNHRIALARELTYAAGVPLRDRYGFAASADTVLYVVNAVFGHPSDEAATDVIGLGNAIGKCELAMGSDQPTDEDYERRIVEALRPLAERRRDAAGKALG
jgi:hypothetical protein